MKAQTKVLIVVVALVIFAMVAIKTVDENIKDKTVEIPKRNFIVLDDTIVGGKYVTVIYDSNRNTTCWIYSGGQRGGISCIPNWQLMPPQNMSSNCNCS
jgi:hypothetical protein